MGSDWVSIDSLVKRYGLPRWTLECRCRRLSREGLASESGGRWYVHRNREPNLTLRNLSGRAWTGQVRKLQLGDVPAGKIAVACQRADVLRAFDRFCWRQTKPLSITHVRRAFVALWSSFGIEHTRISVKTLERYEYAYRGKGLAGLVPKWRTPPPTRSCDPRALAWFRQRCSEQERLNVSAVVRMLREIATANGWAPIPSLRWFRRYVQSGRLAETGSKGPFKGPSRGRRKPV
jgi:hypothetical protein